MANYHPTNEHLMRFAAGQLQNALGVMVACHLEDCVVCRTQAAVYDQLGAQIVESLSPVDMDDSRLQSLLAQLDEPAAEEVEQPVFDITPGIPRPLQRFVPAKYDALPWRGMTRGIKEYQLPFSDHSYTAKFYKIAAGHTLPEHTHRGEEYTLVMAGQFSDKAGDYQQGDFILADTKTIHQPQAWKESDCICFAVMDAPIKLTSRFGRLFNPFIR